MNWRIVLAALLAAAGSTLAAAQGVHTLRALITLALLIGLVGVASIRRRRA